MKRVKVIISFAGMSIPHFIEFCRKVAGKMATNPNLFPNPDVALSTIATQTNILEIKYNAAQEGGKQQKLELDLAYKTLLETMRSEGLYVERIANGNEIIITASGFECSKQPITPNHPDFSVDNTDNEGEIILKRKGTAGVRSWVWQKCSDPIQDNMWQQIGITTQASLTVSNLPQCTRLWFRSASVDKDGQSDWCDPQQIIIT